MFLGIDQQNPAALAVVDDEGHRLSYGELTKEIAAFKTLDLPRSRVFLLCKNSAGSLAGYLGLVETGCVPVTLSDKLDVSFLRHLLEAYEPSYLWVPEEKVGLFTETAENEMLISGSTIYRAMGYVLISTGNKPCPMHEMLELCMTTSGSTGSPKFVRFKKGNLEANAKNVALAWGWTSRERAVCDLSMNYSMGLNVINTHLYVGAAVLLTNYNIMSSEYWNFIKTEKGTNVTGVPFTYDIFARLHIERMDLPDLQTLSQGGGKMTDARFEQFAAYAAKTGKRFIASFGTTETSARMAMLPADLALTKTGSIGRSIPEGEMFLIDENGQVLSDPLAEGELCYTGPNVTMGYAECKEDLIKDDDFNGTYHTGDLARRDEDGCYYVTGRLSRFLKLLSYRVSLDQCERLIQQEFNIECACAGTDKRMNVYILDESKKQEVLEFISAKTNLFKNLFKIIIVPKILRNDSGKIRYKQMDQEYGA